MTSPRAHIFSPAGGSDGRHPSTEASHSLVRFGANIRDNIGLGVSLVNNNIGFF